MVQVKLVRPICWAILLRFLKGLGLQGVESESFYPAEIEMMCPR